MNGVEYSASIMVHIIHATFCTCTLIRKNEPWRGCSDEETFTDNEGTQGHRGRKTRIGSCMRSYMQKFIEQLQSGLPLISWGVDAHKHNNKHAY